MLSSRFPLAFHRVTFLSFSTFWESKLCPPVAAFKRPNSCVLIPFSALVFISSSLQRLYLDAVPRNTFYLLFAVECVSRNLFAFGKWQPNSLIGFGILEVKNYSPNGKFCPNGTVCVSWMLLLVLLAFTQRKQMKSVVLKTSMNNIAFDSFLLNIY